MLHLTKLQSRPHRFRRWLWIRASLFVASLVGCLPAQAQQTGIFERPRMIDQFAPITGYSDLSPDRFGPATTPKPTELGIFLVLRMFRTVCQGIENGEALARLMPPGFAAYDGAKYYFGPDAATRGVTIVLSPTGDIDADENRGHPTLWLDPDAAGMTCRVEWTIPEEIDPKTQQTMARILEQWVPFELSLVRFSRPLLMPSPSQSDLFEWDRPCQGQWCPLTLHYDLSKRRYVTIKTTLNVISIEGERPSR